MPLIYNIAPKNLTKDANYRVSGCLNQIKKSFPLRSELQGGYVPLCSIKDQELIATPELENV